MNNNILQITNMSKEYEQVVALSGINLEIEKGSIFGLLGPNGAGKTSLIRILTGITLPDSGNFILNHTEGKDFDTISSMTGYLPEERGLYPDMKINEQMEFLGQIKGLSLKVAKEKIKEYSEKLGITDYISKKAQECSKGMQQMAQFVATIFFEPNLIILDEPFTGLDPINTNKMKQEILDLQKRGTTIIFSTHRMEQVEEICENIALINKGKIILKGKILDIKKRFKKNIYKIEVNNTDNLPSTPDFEILDQDGCFITVKDNEQNSNPNELLKKIMKYFEVQSFVEILPSLNDIFIEQVKNVGVGHDSPEGGQNE